MLSDRLLPILRIPNVLISSGVKNMHIRKQAKMSTFHGLYGIVFFTPFGFNTPDKQLMTVSLYVCAAVGWVVKYFALFLVIAGVYAGFPLMLSRASHNFAGQYKGYLAMGLHIGIENFSGAMFSNVYRSKDAPRCDAIGIESTWPGIFIVLLNVSLYRRINARREKMLVNREANATMESQDCAFICMGLG
ncbi:hypothetical protein SISNIDRAFT_469467 [Sistotremastrum niveocremeum HHB9708]|uniref:Uncharacterized protein n=1 Tax=Sistotremastrum niveocremeum HHB9708 TaxID=1314777 RepID=A0A164PZF9_9AGAM|nr:hypothetical protein SISNIDRAFT_469467 [Sistotremastrum niveocremeum HHB9708]